MADAQHEARCVSVELVHVASFTSEAAVPCGAAARRRASKLHTSCGAGSRSPGEAKCSRALYSGDQWDAS
eukprot:2526182-Pleurochrysis_carterae.AAC.1